ncbi:MAG: ABC transporter substrate-binding protein [Flexilinea sp.]
MKKISIFVVLLMAFALTFSSVSAESVELVWSGWSGEEASTAPILEGMITAWNEANPDVQVSWVGWPWADTLQQLIIRNDGSEKLDIAQVDSSMFPTLIEAGALIDVTSVIDKAWLDENIPASALGFGQKDGIQYGVPWTTASIGMTYNPELLTATGFAEPPVTISEFEEMLAAIHKANPDAIPYALSTKDSTCTADFLPWLWAFGGDVFDADGNVIIDNAEGVAVLEWYKKLADSGYIQANMSRFDARQLFAQGKVGFYDDAIMAKGIAISNGVDPAKADAVIQPMLRPVLNEGDTPTSTMWGHLLVIFGKSANQKEAAEFLKHVISEEQSLIYFKSTGMLPVINSAINNEAVVNDSWASKWSEITATGRNNPLTLLPQNAELTTIISEEVQAVIVGSKTPQEAAESMKVRLESAL